MTDQTDATNKQPSIKRLTQLVEALRNPETGCPWDLMQTHASLAKQTVEEAYELLHAIAESDSNAVCDELGDLLFHIALYAKIADENKQFDMNDVIEHVCDKMTHRHPHVFSNKSYNNMTEQLEDWEQLKAKEAERNKKDSEDSTKPMLFSAHLEHLPATMQAEKIQKTLKKLGFDWPEHSGVLDKLHEEIGELEEAINIKQASAIEEELGDVLFTCINLARHLGIDADTALYKSNQKFQHRAASMLAMTADKDVFKALSLHEKEALWQQAKKLNKKP